MIRPSFQRHESDPNAIWQSDFLSVSVNIHTTDIRMVPHWTHNVHSLTKHAYIAYGCPKSKDNVSTLPLPQIWDAMHCCHRNFEESTCTKSTFKCAHRLPQPCWCFLDTLHWHRIFVAWPAKIRRNVRIFFIGSTDFSVCSFERSPKAIFTWWGCCGLCKRHKPTELAHSSLFIFVSVSVSVALSTVFHSMNSPRATLRVFTLSSGLISALLVLSTIHLFMKVSSAMI